MKQLAIAYCQDNQQNVDNIALALKPAHFSITYFSCKRNNEEATLADQLQAFNGSILLLISDNFLRSISCMNAALNLLQHRHQDILPVVIDGYQRDTETGELVNVPTRFEKIGDIIPYINYWQNQYLDLRSQRRKLDQDEDFNKEALNEHIRILRQVSAEASEFLRLLRNTPHVNAESLATNDFEALFSFLEAPEEWAAFKVNSTQPADTGTAFAPEPEVYIPTIPETVNQPVDIQPILEGIPIEIEVPSTPEVSNAAPSSSPNEANEPIDFDDQETSEPETPANTPGTEVDGVIPTEPAEIESPDYPAEDATEPPSEVAPVEHSIEDFLLEATRLEQDGHYSESLAVLENALQHYPASHTLRFNYALLLAKQGTELEPAITQLRQLLSAHPNDERANFLLAELLELQEQYQEARDLYQKIAEINPDFKDINYRIGMAALKFDPDKVATAKYFKMACKLNPSNVDAHYQYALLAAEVLNKPDKAIKYFEKTLALSPDHPFANYDLAVLYHADHHFGKAKKYYLQAIHLNPELKTTENDLAFGVPTPGSLGATPPNPEDLSTDDQAERDMIDALKENIARLEQLLQTRKELVTETNRFTGKTVLITGATSGIGRAAALLFAQHGHRLILTGRRAQKLTELCEAIGHQYKVPTLPLVFDVRYVSEVSEAIASIPDDWKNIDILINNAGKAKGLGPIQEGKLEHWEEMIDTNIKGLLYITREVAPLMVQRQKGHIINIGSIAGKYIYPNGNVYCASKAAVEALTEGMRLDLHAHNIRVSQIAPGHVEETEFALVRFDGDAERAKIYEGFQPLTASDIADTIYYIASRPAHVNIQDVVLFSTQQASATIINRSGRDVFKA